MSQNRSHAVMQQRTEAHDSLDDFPTPPWAGRALVEHVLVPHHSNIDRPRGGWPAISSMTVWEPASNRGYLAKSFEGYFSIVRKSDIYDYSLDPATVRCQDSVTDFLFPGSEMNVIAARGVDWIITNPPFRLAEQFFARAAELRPRAGIAFLVRTSFLEGTARYRQLFSKTPPSIIAQFSERVPMVKGRLDGKASTATSYCWLVWMNDHEGTRFVWIPPCRKQLERKGDYPNV